VPCQARIATRSPASSWLSSPLGPWRRRRRPRLASPVFAGETGVFANYLRRGPDWQRIDHDLGLACFREQIEGMRAQGLAGALYWHDGSPDSAPGDESPALALFPPYGKALREAWRGP